MAEIAVPLAVSALGLGVVQGQQAERQQRRAIRSQEEAQKQALAAATSEKRRAEQEQRRLNRRQPDVAAMLLEEGGVSGRGPASTMLTGSSGIDPNRLILGKRSLLGG